LDCAAEFMIDHLHDLAEARTDLYRRVKELVERLQPLSVVLRKFQEGTVAIIARNMHLALLAVGTVLMHWPDAMLTMRYIIGFLA